MGSSLLLSRACVCLVQPGAWRPLDDREMAVVQRALDAAAAADAQEAAAGTAGARAWAAGGNEESEDEARESEEIDVSEDDGGRPAVSQ